MRALAFVLVALVFVPPVEAGPDWLFGTEQLPELPDGAGDVEYDPLYVGAKDHAYVDFLAGWFEYDNLTDTIQFTIKNANGAQLASAPADWNFACSTTGNVATDGAILGELSFIVSKPSGSDMVTYVMFDPTPEDGAVGVATGLRNIDHSFRAELGEPGYFRFVVARDALMQVGDQFEGPRGDCNEDFRTSRPVQTTVMENRDGAESGAAYSFIEHRRLKSPDGAQDPIERAATQSVAADSEPTTSTRTPGPGFVLIVAAIVAGGLALRRP